MRSARRTRFRRAGVLALAGVAAAGSLAGCGGTATAARGDLTLGTDSFAPVLLTVAAGSTVTVANPSSMTHDVVTTGIGFSRKTKAITPGGSTSFRAPTTAGTYKLTCDYHPDMLATLVVR